MPPQCNSALVAIPAAVIALLLASAAKVWRHA